MPDIHVGEPYNRVDDRADGYIEMVMDVDGPDMFDVEMEADELEEPNPDAQKFYDMLDAASEPLYHGCEKHSQLSLISRLMNVKCEGKLSESDFNGIAQLMKEMALDPNVVPENFYQAKKVMWGMGLPVEKIDCCEKLCMLYWGEDKDLDKCKFCNHSRWKRFRKGASNKRQKCNLPFKRMHYFPLTPRLQMLYASEASAKHMRFHAEHASPEEGIMHHPSDSPAWKHFDNAYPDFALEHRNVRLGLCTDGFQPFGSHGKQYSSWPVMLTPYNLPPDMCMKSQFIFLTVLVPGPDNPKDKLDVFLQPLVEELIQLWDQGARTYDVSTKKNFQLKACLLWTVSDFPAYGMLSGWKTGSRLACPHCMEDTDAFSLRCSKKLSWFDKHRKFLPLNHPFRRDKTHFQKNVAVLDREAPRHRSGEEVKLEIEELGLKKVTEVGYEEHNERISKTCGWKRRSILWDLPYWSSFLIHHNLDMMHVEKNNFENLFNTICHIQGKTKDTIFSRNELNDYCRRPELKKDEATGKYPKASYVLDHY